jgi:hypothetical protein
LLQSSQRQGRCPETETRQDNLQANTMRQLSVHGPSGRGGRGRTKGRGEALIQELRAPKGQKRKKEDRGQEVEDGFLLHITDREGAEQECPHQQKQRQKKRPT